MTTTPHPPDPPAGNPSRLAARLAGIELPYVVALSPLLLFPTPARLIPLIGLPIIWAAAYRSSRHVIPASSANPSLVVLLAMVAVSFWATYDHGVSLPKVSGVVLGVLFYWAIVRRVSANAHLLVAMAALAAVTTALSLIGLAVVNPPEKFAALSLILGRLSTTAARYPSIREGVNPNGIAGTLLLVWPLQVSWLAHELQRVRREGVRRPGVVWCLGASAAVSSAGIVLMQSRGAWLAVAVIGAVSVCVGAWVARRARPWRLASRVLLASLVVGAIVTLPGACDRMGQVARPRVVLWRAAADAIRDVPWTGMGLNTFRTVMPVRYADVPGQPAPDIAHAHNQILQTAVDLGIPGVIAYLALLASVAGQLLWVVRHAVRRDHRWYSAGLLAGLAAHMVFGLADAVPLGSKVGLVFWLTLALATALWTVAKTESLIQAPARLDVQEDDGFAG